jgi:glyoxylase-like metal-dependent hydrolase (beta-lactamase superfamily II)
MTMQIVTLNHNYVRQNSYVLIDGRDAAVIDPGFNGKAIRQILTEYDASIRLVLLTHVHYDHIRDLELFGEDVDDIPVVFHHAEEAFFTDAYKNYAKAFSRSFNLPAGFTKQTVNHGDSVAFTTHTIAAHHTPGHTKGSLSYAVGDDVFTGDTLFFDSIGRTDLYSGDADAIARSVAYLFDTFDPDVTVHPGHGRSATLSEIKENNPYV